MRFGRYRVVRELGRGAQGVVHLAEDTELGRRVALKVLPGSFTVTDAQRERFRREAAAVSRIDHPDISTVYEAGLTGNTPWIAMRYVEGKTLHEVLGDLDDWGAEEGASDGSAALPAVGTVSHVTAVVALFERIARALHFAHEHGLVHRDIKPGNVMLTPEGAPVLLDFGLVRDDDPDSASLTATGSVLGTPAYLAPELLTDAGTRPDRRVDVYALGVTLYEALTLHLPFEAPTRERLYHRILTSEPDDPRATNVLVAGDLKVVLDTALEKDPRRRYQTALALAEDLERVRTLRPIAARPPTLAYRCRRWAQRNRALAVSMASIVFLLSTGLALTGGLLKTTSDALDALELETTAKDEARRKADAQARRVRSMALVQASNAERAERPDLALWLALQSIDVARSDQAVTAVRRAMVASRLRRVIRAHEVGGASLEVLADGSCVTSGSDGTACRWNRDGSEAVRLVSDSVGVQQAVATVDGLAATMEDGSLRFALPGGHVVSVPPTERRKRWIRRAPDGTVWTADGLGAPQRWDGAGNPMPMPRWPDDLPASIVTVSPDLGRALVTLGDNSKALVSLEGEAVEVLRLRLQDNGDGTNTIGPPTPRASGADWSEDGRFVAVTAQLNCEIWSRDGERLRVLEHTQKRVVSVRTIPGSDGVVTANGLTAVLWDGEGNAVATLDDDGGYSWTGRVDTSPDGRFIATASGAGAVDLWDLEGNRTARLTLPGLTLTCVAFGPDSREVFALSRDGRLLSFALHGSEQEQPLDALLQGVFLLPDPQREAWVVSDEEGNARLVDDRLRSHEVAANAVRKRATHRIHWSRDGSTLAVTDNRYGVVMDRHGRVLWTMNADEGEAITMIVPSPSGDRWLVLLSPVKFEIKAARVAAAESGDETLRLAFRRLMVHRDRQRVVELEPSDNKIFSADWFPDGSAVVTAGHSTGTAILDAEGRIIRSFGAGSPKGRVVRVAPDGTWFALATHESQFLLMDREGNVLFDVPEQKAKTTRIAIDPLSEMVLAANGTGSLRLIRRSDGGERVLNRPDQRRETVFTALDWSADGSMFLAGRLEEPLEIWSRDGSPLVQLDIDGGVRSAYFVDGDHCVRVLGADGEARLVSLDEGRLLEHARARVFPPPTRLERERYADILGDDNGVWLEAHALAEEAWKPLLCKSDARRRIHESGASPVVVERALELVEVRSEGWRESMYAAWTTLIDFDAARADVEAACEWSLLQARRTPLDPSMNDLRAAALLRAGRPEEALRVAEAELETQEVKTEQTLALRVLCLAALHRTEAARGEWETLRTVGGRKNTAMRFTYEPLLQRARLEVEGDDPPDQ